MENDRLKNYLNDYENQIKQMEDDINPSDH